MVSSLIYVSSVRAATRKVTNRSEGRARLDSLEGDELVRHLMQAGTMDTDGVPHTAKAAWRALELLQREIEAGLYTFENR